MRSNQMGRRLRDLLHDGMSWAEASTVNVLIFSCKTVIMPCTIDMYFYQTLTLYTPTLSKRLILKTQAV